jgi:hypothetical protein
MKQFHIGSRGAASKSSKRCLPFEPAERISDSDRFPVAISQPAIEA